MELNKFSMGIGDRFGHQAKAQLKAIMKASETGIQITPVWNKSFREHEITQSHPKDTRRKADEAVSKLNWNGDYYVDADHVNLNSIDLFIDNCDFFTIDVADYIGKIPSDSDLKSFMTANKKYTGGITIEGVHEKFIVDEDKLKQIGLKYLYAVKEANKIYEHLYKARGKNGYIVEVSLDETNTPQSPIDLLFILSAISQEGIPIQTIAPKFSGRFNKGIDYEGDISQFTNEFEQDLAMLKYAKKVFTLPDNLKLSIHSGSDKFSIYEPIRQVLKKFDAGIHIKTAGTTWLEELIGLSLAGDKGISIATEVYENAFKRFEELCTPYASVIDIRKEELPPPTEVRKWSGEIFAATLRHDQSNKNYNSHFRQLLHVAYKIATEMGKRYADALDEYEEIIELNVTENIFERHIKKIFF
jgi:hypothetical protein